jgi:hypothetical protein
VSVTKCEHCNGTGIVSTGYHGPPGDDRGHLPCPHCQRRAYDNCFSRGNFIYGVSISEAFDAVREANGEAPINLGGVPAPDPWGLPGPQAPDAIPGAAGEDEGSDEDEARRRRQQEMREELEAIEKVDFLH